MRLEDLCIAADPEGAAAGSLLCSLISLPLSRKIRDNAEPLPAVASQFLESLIRHSSPALS